MAQLTPEDLDRLEKVAGNAKAGPWQRDGVRKRLAEEDCISCGPDGFPIFFLPIGPDGQFHAQSIRDAEHIASFDPPTALALISQARETSALREALETIAGQATLPEWLSATGAKLDDVRGDQSDDWHAGYDAAVEHARAALKNVPESST